MRARTTGTRASVASLVVALTAIGIGACGDEEEPPTAETHLSIASSDSPGTVTLDATEGQETTVSSPVEGDVDVVVEEVDGDEIEFSTSERMAPEGETGGINLMDPQTRFTVTKGEPTTFSTPTTDGGTTWTVTLENGPTPS